MAYARFFDSDVYVFADVRGGITCCGCLLNEITGDNVFPDDFNAKSTQGIVDHLKLHEAKGHNFPIQIYNWLWADDAENFPKGDAARGKRGK